MTDQAMTTDRFEALAAAYGADPERWPAAERGAGRAFAETPEGRAAMEAAARIDGALDGYLVAPPSAGLYARIIASAPQPRLAAQSRRSWWLPGLGLATLAAAGAIAGALIVTRLPQLAPMPDFGWDYESPTAFGDLGIDQES